MKFQLFSFMKHTKNLLMSVVTVGAIALLTACGGGGGGGSSSASVSYASATDATVMSYLASSNTSNTNFPWTDSAYNACSGKSKRWVLPIDVRAPDATTTARAVTAMNTIEAKLGYTVFDRTNISVTPPNAGTGFVGIIFSAAGHSYVPPATTPAPGNTYVANVSAGPDVGNWASASLNGSCAITATLYINLDNSFGYVADADVVTHEFGHALGLGSHFAGYGTGPSISKDFWDVLATLYGSTAGTVAASIPVVRTN